MMKHHSITRARRIGGAAGRSAAIEDLAIYGPSSKPLLQEVRQEAASSADDVADIHDLAGMHVAYLDAYEAAYYEQWQRSMENSTCTST